MYGTVAILRLMPGAIAGFEQAMGEVARAAEFTSGFISAYTYHPQKEPDTVILCVVYDSEESYRANAQSSETHGLYLKWRDMLAEEPVWHDGEARPFLRFT
ncbi:MAG: antibiotic biosynthesis monooxygenase [Dehalococcoidia bacterium]